MWTSFMYVPQDREGEAAKKSGAVFDILCGHLLGAFSFQTASEKASERKRPIRKNARTDANADADGRQHVGGRGQGS